MSTAEKLDNLICTEFFFFFFFIPDNRDGATPVSELQFAP